MLMRLLLRMNLVASRTLEPLLCLLRGRRRCTNRERHESLRSSLRMTMKTTMLELAQVFLIKMGT